MIRHRDQMMNRRRFVSTAAMGLLTAPLAAEAQQAEKVRRIGSLGTGPLPTPAELAQSPLLQELKRLGWIEGQNLVIERRLANSAVELEALASELVRLKVEIITVPNAGLAAIAQKATRTIPIVAISAGDLSNSGLVASLSRPGGNVTGMQLFSPELMGKRLQILKEVVPSLSRMVCLTGGSGISAVALDPVYRQATDEAARRLGIRVRYAAFRQPEELTAIFDEIVREHDQALLVWANPFVNLHRHAIAERAVRNRLLMMGEFQDYSEDGLLVYGPVLDDVYRASAGYVDRILRGGNPGELPIGQPTRFELIINLRIAKALGLTIPQSLLGRADRVIE